MFLASCELPGRVCYSRACHPRQGGMTPDDRDPSWITDPSLTGSRCLSERPPTTNHATSNVSKRSRQNEGTDKTKPRHSENKDHCCPFSGTPLCFSSSCCQPLRILTLREQQHSLTWQLKLSNASEWEEAPPEGEAPRGDCGFTIDETEHLCLKAR